MAEIKLDVCEIYPTLKSSGADSGKSVLCIRLFGTNFKDNHDLRRYAWDKSVANLKANRKRLTIDEVLQEINNVGKGIKHWVFTGGEALLQQEGILELIRRYKESQRKPFIEVDTNGLISPLKKVDVLVNRYNTNINLSRTMQGNARSTFGQRIHEGVLKEFVNNKKAEFIFEVSDHTDIKEVLEIKLLFKINEKRIWLKPVEIDSRGAMRGMPILWKACLAYKFRLSNKLYMYVGGKIQRGI